MECLNSDPTKLLASCEDGSVCVYDLKSNKTIFKLEPGHSETIFDLEYNTKDYGIFATCSHEGTIKIWDMNKNKITSILKVDAQNVMKSGKIDNSNDTKVSILCIKWSPKEKNLLISGDSTGHIKLWDTSKEKLLDSCKHSPKDYQIHGIDWDENDNIICSGNDTAKLFKLENLKLINKNTFESNPSTNLFQIKFNPFENLSFIAAGQDGNLKIFNEKSKKNTSELKGHTKKVFGICFNPERNGILASSSDDMRIGIWDIPKNKSNFLTGHTNNVRQLVWLKESGNILISGSWDGNIKFWNVDSLQCIYTITEHYSDVYGLDICSDHPYLLMSSSRDNSIRFWNIPSFSDNMVCYI